MQPHPLDVRGAEAVFAEMLDDELANRGSTSLKTLRPCWTNSFAGLPTPSARSG